MTSFIHLGQRADGLKGRVRVGLGLGKGRDGEGKGSAHLVEADTRPLIRPTLPKPLSDQNAPTSSRNVSSASSGSPTCVRVRVSRTQRYT